MAPPLVKEEVDASAGGAATVQDDNDKELEENPSIAKLVRRLLSGEQDKVDKSLSKLINLTYSGENSEAETNRQTILDLGGHLAAIQIAESATRPRTVGHALNVLQNLAFPEHGKAVIRDLGGLEIAVSTMKAFPTDYLPRTSACGLITNLTFNSDAARETALEIGAIELIAESMKGWPKDEKLQELACGTLDNLSRNTTNVMKEALLAHAWEVLGEALKNHGNHETIKKYASSTIQHLIA